MAASRQARALPYGMGHLNLRWVAIVVALLAILGLGAYGYSRQLTEGEIVTGLRDVGTRGGAPWGIYIAFELYAVGIGFGAMILLGVIRLMGLSHLGPLTRTLGLVTLTTLVIGYLAVIADLGQPLRAMINIARYARPMSPFFGTFTVGLVTSIAAVSVYLYLDIRRDAATLAERPSPWRRWLRFIAAGYRGTPAEEKRHQHASLALAGILILVGISAAASSGFVFAVNVARPGWQSALQAPAFVVLAATTATAVLAIVAAGLRRTLGETQRLNMRVFLWLNNLMAGLTFIYLYFLLAELITGGYTGHHHEARLTQVLTTGTYAWMYWLSGGLFLIAFVTSAAQALVRRYSLPLIISVALVINAAALFKRYLIVVPSLTHGNLLPYPTGSYSPTWPEFGVVLGLVAFGVLLYIMFLKVFPIMEVQEES